MRTAITALALVLAIPAHAEDPDALHAADFMVACARLNADLAQSYANHNDHRRAYEAQEVARISAERMVEFYSHAGLTPAELYARRNDEDRKAIVAMASDIAVMREARKACWIAARLTKTQVYHITKRAREKMQTGSQ